MAQSSKKAKGSGRGLAKHSGPAPKRAVAVDPKGRPARAKAPSRVAVSTSLKLEKNFPTKLAGAVDAGARCKIMEAAVRLFADRGLDGTSTRDIAKASGLNLSLISYYFGGKEGLFCCILHDFALQVKEQIVGLLAQFDHVEMTKAALRTMIFSIVDALIDVRTENPHLAVIMIREKVSGMPNTKEIHEQIFIRIGEKIRDTIVRAQKHGIVNKKINPDFFVLTLLDSIVAYFVMHDSPVTGSEIAGKCYRLPLQKEEYKNQIALVFLEGILK